MAATLRTAIKVAFSSKEMVRKQAVLPPQSIPCQAVLSRYDSPKKGEGLESEAEAQKK